MLLRPLKLWVQSGAYFQQRPHLAVDPGVALGRRGQPREDLEQRALTGAILAHHAEDRAVLRREADVPQGAQSVRSWPSDVVLDTARRQTRRPISPAVVARASRSVSYDRYAPR